MKKITVLLFIMLPLGNLLAQTSESSKRIISTIDSSMTGELVLIQEFEVAVPLKSVWDIYSTEEGWESVFVVKAKVDFKIGGTIQTHYNAEGTIGDSNTIVLHIINYVPHKMLTLQAELTRHFPEMMKANAKNLYNIIYLESLSPERTKVTSYGVGYSNTPKYLDLMKFFIPANEQSYLKLIRYLEAGKK